MDLPDPGGPISSRLWPPAAAIAPVAGLPNSEAGAVDNRFALLLACMACVVVAVFAVVFDVSNAKVDLIAIPLAIGFGVLARFP